MESPFGVRGGAGGPVKRAWVVLGQSNDLPRTTNDNLITFPSATRQWGYTANAEAAASSPLDMGDEDGGDGGLYENMARQFEQDFPNDTLYIIGCAWGGTNFETHWNKGNSLFTAAAARVSAFLAAHPDAQIDCIFGHPIESQSSSTFESLLDQFIFDVRDTFEGCTQSTPFVVVQTMPGTADKIANNAIVLDTPNRVSNTAVQISDDLLAYDGTHYRATSNHVRAERRYAAMASLVGFTPAAPAAPSVVEYDSANNPNKLGTYTFEDINVGTGDLIVGVSFRGTNSPISSGTAGGDALTFLNNTSGGQNGAWAYLKDVTAGTMDIVINFAGGTEPFRAGIHVWTVSGGDLDHATRTQLYVEGSDTAGRLVFRNGIMLAVGATTDTSTPAFTWDGLTARGAVEKYSASSPGYVSGAADDVMTGNEIEHVVDMNPANSAVRGLNVLFIPSSDFVA